MKATATLTIGRLAAAAGVGVGVETIRYYQRQGLLDEPQKPASGYRKYAAETVDRLHFIRRAKQLGFTLREIRDLLALGDGQCQQVQQIAREKAGEIARRIRDFEAMAAALQTLFEHCDTDQQRAAQCSLFAALRHE